MSIDFRNHCGQLVFLDYPKKVGDTLLTLLILRHVPHMELKFTLVLPSLISSCMGQHPLPVARKLCPSLNIGDVASEYVNAGLSVNAVIYRRLKH